MGKRFSTAFSCGLIVAVITYFLIDLVLPGPWSMPVSLGMFLLAAVLFFFSIGSQEKKELRILTQLGIPYTWYQNAGRPNGSVFVGGLLVLTAHELVFVERKAPHPVQRWPLQSIMAVKYDIIRQSVSGAYIAIRDQGEVVFYMLPPAYDAFKQELDSAMAMQGTRVSYGAGG